MLADQMGVSLAAKLVGLMAQRMDLKWVDQRVCQKVYY
jgi:hypothetical protein